METKIMYSIRKYNTLYGISGSKTTLSIRSYNKLIFVTIMLLLFVGVVADPGFVDRYSHNWRVSNPDYATLDTGLGGLYHYNTGLNSYSENTAQSQYSLNLKAGWNWVSFPVLLRDPDLNKPVSFLSVANLISPYGIQIRSFYDRSFYFSDMWQPLFSGIYSSEGYKIMMAESKKISFTGSTLNPATKINLYSWRENWIGYFLPETVLLKEAFSPEILSNITSIKTKDGAMFRSGRNWLGTDLPLTLSYGEMLIVTVFSDTDFTWQNGTLTEPYIKKKASYFIYKEMESYISIFVEIDQNNPPLEIAAMINGVCKGASVYEGGLTEILVYLDEEDLNQEIELFVVYDVNSPAIKILDYALVNPHNFKLEFIPVIVRLGSRYFHIKLTDYEIEDLTNPFNQLLQNTPEPFSQETKIDFFLAQPDNVQISVYNSKRQKVKDLFTGPKQAGKHSVIWDGKDSMNKQVSSGIYLYKLNTRHGSIQRKMTLIK